MTANAGENGKIGCIDVTLVASSPLPAMIAAVNWKMLAIVIES
jgi:hypothetical protein